METNNNYRLVPGFGESLGNGWKVMMDNFLRLFLVVLILSIVAVPFRTFHFHFNMWDFQHIPFNWWHRWHPHDFFTMGSLGIFAAFFVFLALLYAFLVAPVFRYGGKMIFLQAVRRDKIDFETLVSGFVKNYLHIILANLLVAALVILGLFALIIPGIIIGCRLAFVPYIVMDKNLDPIEAVETSWRMTRGWGWTIFFMGFVSFFIIIFGLMLLIVGVFPAAIWVASSFASMYESVRLEKEPAAVEPLV